MFFERTCRPLHAVHIKPQIKKVKSLIYNDLAFQVWWAQGEDFRTGVPSPHALELLETLAEWSDILASEVPELRPPDREARPNRGLEP